IPLRWADAPRSDAPRSDAPPHRRYLEQELLEVSAVGIPANPNALVLGLKAGAIEADDLRELAGILSALNAPRSTLHAPRSTEPHSAFRTPHSEFPRAAAGANTGALCAG